jgi:hypothetical protein
MRSAHLLFLVGMTCVPGFAGAQSVASDEAASQLAQARQNVAAAAQADVNYLPWPAATEKSAWVGIGVSPAPEVIRRQLGLPEGTGLVVEVIMPKSPAAQADVKPYDVLVKLDDQILINPEQFAVLVRMHKEGERVKLTFAREGKEQTASVQLVGHDVPKVESPGNSMNPGMWWTPVPYGANRNGQPEVPMRFGTPVPGGPDVRGQRFEPQRTVTWIDGNHQITLATLEGHRFLRITDKEGDKTLFSGPIDTDQQWKALPTDVQDALKSLKITRPKGGDGAEPESPETAEPQNPQKK